MLKILKNCTRTKAATTWEYVKHKYRHWPLALLLCIVYVVCLLLFNDTFSNHGLLSAPLAPFISTWVTLGAGIFMCILSFFMFNCQVPENWVHITNWDQFRENLTGVELPNHYAYYGPTSTTRKYTHHFIVTNFELIFSSNEETDPKKATDAKIFTKEYIDSYFPRLWYQRPRAVCCCNAKRCCWFGWVGAGQIQRREYLASEVLKRRGTVFNVRKNGDTPVSPTVDRCRRLQQRNGEPFWDLIINNCEHYANWIMTGEHYAVQIATGPFWELYFLNSIGRVLLGTMQSVVVTVIFRLGFVILFVWAYAISYQHTRTIYWCIIYLIVFYNGITYLATEIAKVVHLKRCCGNNRFCYPCYSDYLENKPGEDRVLVDIEEITVIEMKPKHSDSTVSVVTGEKLNVATVEVRIVWPHEGLKFNSSFSMPIVPCMFKSFYLFLFSSAALFGGSWLGMGPTVRDLLPKVEGLPISELIMQTATSLEIYVFWYPLMTSSLDFFLWHKPNKFISLLVYLAFTLGLLWFLALVIEAGIYVNQNELMDELMTFMNATNTTYAL